MAEAKKATSVFRLGDLEEFLPRGCFEPTVVGQFHGWHLEKTTGFFMEGLEMSDFYPTKSTECGKMTSFYTFFTGIHEISRCFLPHGKVWKIL